MEYKWEIETPSPYSCAIRIEAENIKDAIKKISKKIGWQTAKRKELPIEVWEGDRAKLTVADLNDKNKYMRIYPKYFKI